MSKDDFSESLEKSTVMLKKGQDYLDGLHSAFLRDIESDGRAETKLFAVGSMNAIDLMLTDLRIIGIDMVTAAMSRNSTELAELLESARMRAAQLLVVLGSVVDRVEMKSV